jgi:mannose-6-phosphate isomerase
MVWGGRRLGEVLGKSLGNGASYGESWEVSDHALHRSRVASGPLAGCTLRELMEARAADLLGTAAATHAAFPWLVKFLDARDWLSVQVHPDAEAVKHLWPGENSKTEAWFILEAAPGSRVFAGLLPGIDAPQLRSALDAGTVDRCLHSFEPTRGDCVFLPAGTVHAVGGGVLMAEIQQTSDATFRLFDWNRCDSAGKVRTLHIDQALESIHWDRGPVQPVSLRQNASALPMGDQVPRQPLVRCPYFEADHICSSKAFAVGGDQRLHGLLVSNGRGRWLAGGEEEVRAGEVWVIPACLGPIWCEPSPSLEGLLFTLP